MLLKFSIIPQIAELMTVKKYLRKTTVLSN